MLRILQLLINKIVLEKPISSIFPKKMKFFRMFFVSCLLSYWACNGKSTNDTKKFTYVQTLQGEFEKHFRLLYSAAQKSATDTVRCYMASIEFMEEHTGVEAHTEGSYVGPLDFLKSDLREWRQWYELHIGDSLSR